MLPDRIADEPRASVPCIQYMQFEEQAHSAETEDLGTKRVYEYFALFPLSVWCEWQLKALICAK